MTTITLTEISKTFSRQTIFNSISFSASAGDTIAITGFNGSGKSTLLQIIAGYVSPSKGSIEYLVNNTVVLPDDLYRHISIAAPYLEVIEEFTLSELLNFYSKFKNIKNVIAVQQALEESQAGFTANKPIKQYSSGMKQRVKLALALMSNVPFIFLDEPLSNLDKKGEVWFNKLMVENKENKIVFIGSNSIQKETTFCNKTINLEDFKKI